MPSAKVIRSVTSRTGIRTQKADYSGIEGGVQKADEMIGELLAILHTHLPKWMTPGIAALMDLRVNADIVVERLLSFFDSVRYNPPDDLMDIIRRIQKLTRPIEEDLDVVVDHEGNVAPSTPVVKKYVHEVSSVTEAPKVSYKRDPRSGKLQPDPSDIFF